MDTFNPMLTFFTPDECSTPLLLYSVLDLPAPSSGPSGPSSSAPKPTHSAESIRKAYRRAALRFHPDKHAHKSEQEQEDAKKSFQRVGFAYLVLGDEARRARYDATGETGEQAFEGPEGGWEAYFEAVYTKVDKKLLDEDKARYQGSDEERTDLLGAYTASSGSLDSILASIPHATTADETRLIALIDGAIGAGELERTKAWTASAKTGYAAGRKKREKTERREAKEAEEQARKLGVWDEFYGGGKKEGGGEAEGRGKRKANGAEPAGKTSGKHAAVDDDEEDTSALAALIQSRQKQRAGAMDALVAKYEAIAKAEAEAGEGEDDGEDEDGEEPSSKRRKSGGAKGKSMANGKGKAGGKAGKGGKGKAK